MNSPDLAYVYDVSSVTGTVSGVDDLLSVNQLGASGDTARYRTFTYDSLSRLTNACNPETIKSGGRLYADRGTLERGLHLRGQ
jgi:hypothetical protein